MTWKKLAKQIKKMTPEQRRLEVRIKNPQTEVYSYFYLKELQVIDVTESITVPIIHCR